MKNCIGKELSKIPMPVSEQCVTLVVALEHTLLTPYVEAETFPLILSQVIFSSFN